MALALSLVYAWLTVIRPKGSARERERERERGHILLLLGGSPLDCPCRAANTPKARAGGQEYVCVCASPPPLGTICYPTTEPPRMGPEEGQLGVLQGRKGLKVASPSNASCRILPCPAAPPLDSPDLCTKPKKRAAAILDIRP